MKVDVEVRPGAGRTSLEGPHELAWSYLLDAVFADAFTAGLERLVFLLPDDVLREEIELRATLTPPRDNVAGAGWVTCLTDSAAPPDTARRYQIRAGLRELWRVRAGDRVASSTEAPRQCLSAYTGSAVVLGILLRVASTTGRSDMADRISFAIRRCFATTHVIPAFYHMTVWSTPQGWSRAVD